jgi:hypothetical protein
MMTLSLTQTLGEIRNSVMLRAGVGQPGPSNAALQMQIDEFINQCQLELYFEAEWVRESITSSFPFVAGVANYNIPDDCDVGNINRLYIMNTKGSVYQPKFDFLVDFLNAYKTSGMPRFWTIQDGVIRFTPAPDATTWITCHLDYAKAAVKLVNDTDRPAVDSEAVIQRAAIKVKSALGVGGPLELDMASHMRYLDRLRVNQGPPQMFTIASRKIDGPAYWDRARSVPYTPDWNPPGAW